MTANRGALERYLLVNSMLLKKQFPSKQDLAKACSEDFGTSESTLDKDLLEMRTVYKAPIAYDKVKNGYHYTNPKYHFLDIYYNENNLEGVVFGLAFMQQIAGTLLFEGYEEVVKSIFQKLPAYSKSNGQNNFLKVDTPTLLKGAELLKPLVKALQDKQIIELTYRKYSQENTSVQQVSPYCLREYRNRWYVFGYSNIGNIIKAYALDRIEKIQPMPDGEYIEAAESGFDINLFFKDIVGITQNNKPIETIELYLHDNFFVDYLSSYPIHQTQNIQALKNDGKSGPFGILTLKVKINPELVAEILSFGDRVEVIKPETLLKEVYSTSSNMATRAKQRLDALGKDQ